MQMDAQPNLSNERADAAGERLAKLAVYIQNRAPVSFERIRADLPEYGFELKAENARRMFERDKSRLRALGLVLEVDANGFYSLDTTANYAAPLVLTQAQEAMLRLVCLSLIADEDYPYHEDLRMALIKISDEVGGPDEIVLDDVERSLAKRSKGMNDLLKIQDAIGRRKELYLEYRDSRGKETSRSVRPFGCFSLDGHQYLVAYDIDHAGERLFRVDRITKMKVNTRKPSSADFDPIPFRAEDWYGLPFQFGPNRFEAHVRFEAESAWRIERLCMRQGTFEHEGDAMVWHILASNATALARWCIENGPGIVPVEPVAAYDAYVDGIRRAKEVLR